MRRGGGKRSGGGRRGGRSRVSSSSRRHYRGRRHGGYYGYGGYHSRRTNPAIFLIFLAIFGIAIITVVALMVGGDQGRTDDLQPGEMAIFDSSGYASIDITGSTFTAYFFDSKPSSFNVLNYSYTNSSFISSDDYDYWEDFFISGTEITISWSSNFDIDFYLIRGESNFNNWKDGDSTEYYQTSGSVGSYTYVSGDERIYFVFENSSSNSNSISVGFDIETPLFNTLEAKETQSIPISDKNIEYDFIVIENTGLYTSQYSITLHKQYGFWTIFLPLLVIFTLFVWWLGKKISGGSRSVNSQMRQPTGFSSDYGSSGYQINTPKQQHFNQPSPTSDYIQRPTPKYCGNCGTSVLNDTRFCPSCGQKVI